MGILFDECMSKKLYREYKKVYSPAFLVEHVSNIMPGASDLEVYIHALQNEQVVVSQDKDFKGLEGVIYYKKKGRLRMKIHREIIK